MSRRSSLPTARRPFRRSLAVLVVAAGLAAPSSPAAATTAPGPSRQAEEPTPTTPSDGGDPAGGEAAPSPLGPLPEVAPELADVALSSPTYDPARARRDDLAEQREAALALAARKDAEIQEGTAREAELTAQVRAAQREAERWEAIVARLDREVRAVAVDSYIRGTGHDVGPLFALDADAHDREATAAVTSGSLARRQVAELEDAQRRARRHRNDEELATAVREGVRASIAEARLARDEARSQAERLAVQLVAAQAEVEAQSRLAEVVGADFPLVVLDAYWKAARISRLIAPGCGIEWWALAGIGKIESRHGTYGGAEVRADGSLTKPIIGIPLTGSGGTAAIGDSDGGLIDGDPTVDRAAGPMQFIPQTWQAYGVDGNQDGVVEIQNIYDAAASAARYLCAAAGSMTDVAGLQRGYFAYNRSSAYVASVLAQAVRYGNAVELDGVARPPAAPPPPPPTTPATGTDAPPATGTDDPPPAAGTEPTDTAPPVTDPAATDPVSG